jgi:hypothetical protein
MTSLTLLRLAHAGVGVGVGANLDLNAIWVSQSDPRLHKADALTKQVNLDEWFIVTLETLCSSGLECSLSTCLRCLRTSRWLGTIRTRLLPVAQELKIKTRSWGISPKDAFAGK